ncbi:MAG: DUF309 domain-containing protein [Deltaproteobacteria bacterium]|nr:DUF309 domain-containing protein [Deltaproteobacteria bacterium]
MVSADDPWGEALARFLEGRYWAALMEFERLGRRAAGEERTWLQGWVLLAAALFHRDRGNTRGAQACFARAERRWERLAGRQSDRDAEGTLAAVRQVLDREWVVPRFPFGPDEPEPQPMFWEEDWSEST